MKLRFKRFAQKSKAILIFHHIYDNWRHKRRFTSNNTLSYYNYTHGDRRRETLPEILAYINLVFDEYLMYSGISAKMLRRKNVLEIGFGDNLGVALKFLSAGVSQVVCIDKFYSMRNEKQQLRIYQALREQLSEKEKHHFDNAIQLSNGIEINSQKLQIIHGVGIENADKSLSSMSFDFIVSRGVMHFVRDSDSAFSVMNKALSCGGYMLHKIDFRDVGIFDLNGFHPLEFLTISDPVYKMMTSDSFKPNRRLLDYYRSKMIELRYDSKIFITKIVGGIGEITPHQEKIVYGVDYSDSTVSLIHSIRSNLQRGYKHMANEELMVAGIFLIAQKP